ncbi:hypothetical protein, conserved [Entamoeba dispar SAW760]|uniref:Leucine rich repeat containing protein BspA family protein n=1 Tax=Entamoeba dispar (strain ATCC PRA-260 / SAW760) TaxID=370354 RepID=B0EGD2_ENTDS|nr:uncharacterized protein EDI_226140 [Entamoeba dispar SAW760]EDR26408.1 hypothetical protein, conserved [Entamoeba dispar SAW760]|eukprot:EDR26408.1 hypothetical protein, conserved [Entamoeba dispar SAW760]
MKRTLDKYTGMIVSTYFENINDFINFEMTCKKYEGNMEKFHFNPIPITIKTRRYFPNIETLHLRKENEEKIEGGKINKKVIWYKKTYSDAIEEINKGNECKNICYTKEDRKKYGNNVPKNVNILENECYSHCIDLETVTIPSNVKSIGYKCFCGCTSLKSINIPQSVTLIGDKCFLYCISLTSISLPQHNRMLDWMCFYGCDKLTRLTFKSSV